MESKEKEMEKAVKILDKINGIAISILIALTVLYVYESFIYFSGDKLLPSLAKYIMKEWY